jgi:hypothetical protein
MGERFINYQICCDLTGDITSSIRAILIKKAYVSLPKDGWITIYDEASEDHFDYTTVSQFAQHLSQRLSAVVFSFVVVSGLYSTYLLYDRGERIDQFHSDPEGFKFGFEQCTEDTLESFRGNPERLLSYCLPGTDISEIQHILTASRNGELDFLGQETIYELATLLGIDGYRAITGYQYFEENSLHNTIDPVLPDAHEFLLVTRS